jgi:hypothetical protein
MATIKKNKRLDGSFGYCVRLHFKDKLPICLTFNSLCDAKNWIKENESRHALGQQITQKELDELRLKLKRENRFGKQ